MRKAILISVWAIVLLNMVFFTDIIINYFVGNTQSIFSGATTEGSQAALAGIMDFICLMILYFYTSVLLDKERV